MRRHSSSHWPSWPAPFDLELSVSPPEVCPYVADRTMKVRGFACERVPGSAYQRLLDAGFRRSGLVYYQPACSGCRACVPLRVPVARFVPSRSQRRCWRRNSDLTATFSAPLATTEKHELFARYLEAQHRDGAMTGDRESFDEFLYTAATDTVELTLRDSNGRLVGLGICDVTPVAVSTVYFASEPDCAQRSLGTYSSLLEIDFAERTGRTYYYLGYWVADSRKMAYKNRFRPCEALDTDGVWRAVDEPVTLSAASAPSTPG